METAGNGQAQPTARLQIGASGHRTVGRLGGDLAALREQIRAIFEVLQESAREGAGNGESATLAVISPLAEGADSIVAREALALGLPLYCPLPFARDDYEHDFKSAAARAEYRQLLGLATVVEELPGEHATRRSREAAYTAVGRLVVDRSDVVIAIWDGQAARGPGGTGHVVRDALERHRPVVWIAAHAPYTIRVLQRTEDAIRIGEGLAPLAEWGRALRCREADAG